MNIQVPGTHLCGHTGTLYGTGRNGRIQGEDRSYLRHNLCPGCNSKIQSLIDAARADTACLAQASGLQRPVAKGTPKQVPWANSIVGQVFPLLSAIAAAGRAQGDELGTAVARAIALICQITDAGFWIKRQDAFRTMNSYCITGEVADVLRKASHSYQGSATSWLAGLIPHTCKPDKHYQYAQRALLSQLLNEPATLDAFSNGSH